MLQPTEVMASREYTVESSQPPRKVVIRIGFPKQMRPDGWCECVAEIDDGVSINVKTMNGVDAFEALFVAIMLIGTELTFIQENLQRNLTWMNGERHHLAFPTNPEFRLSAIHPPGV